jgi:magnesium-transporting ATPase (P-type)
VRRLAQPETLRSAAISGLATALACYPRLSLWTKRPYPLWYLEAVIFLGTIVLWAFVFAWHIPYANRPVLARRPGFVYLAAATVAGISCALALRLFLDPALRLQTPEDYPATLNQWIAMTLFTLAFSQLFLVFAPFAWLVRLVQNRFAAAMLTVVFGVFVLAIKTGSSPTPFPLPLFSALLVVRVGLGLFAVFFYLRGGVALVWWLGLLVEARHLPSLG